MPRKPRKKSFRQASLHPSEISFLLDDDSFCRTHIPRDLISLKYLRQGDSGLLYGMKSATELLEEYGQEALKIFKREHPGGTPTWWPLLTTLGISWAKTGRSTAR
jgi:hypothetical protein